MAYTSLHLVQLASSVLLLLTLQWQTAASQNTDQKQLYFMYLTSKSSVFNSSGSVASVDMALEKINADPFLLPSYQLNYSELFDSECDGSTSKDVFFGEILRQENFTQYIALLGAGCSVASLPIAEVIPYYNMPMISYASSADALSDRDTFKTYFRTAISEFNLVPGFADLITFHEWRQAVFITQEEELFLSTQMEVINLLTNVTITRRVFPSDGDPLELDDLFVRRMDSRIFILNMYSTFARRILCKAYHEGMFYPRYTWITYGWYLDGWWREDTVESTLPSLYNCTDDNLITVLSRSVSILQYPVVNESVVTDSGLNFAEFREEYNRRLVTYDLLSTGTAVLAYDAVWGLALALNASIEMVMNNNSGGCGHLTSPLVPFENFTYSNDKLLCVLQSKLQDTQFLGLSGDISFDQNGNRQTGTVQIEQYRTMYTNSTNNDLVNEVIAISRGGTFQFINGQNLDSVWPDAVAPDGIPNEILTTIEPILAVILGILAVSGIAFSVACLIFNIVFRKRKVVRLTSPNLNYLIIVGAVFLYTSVVALILPTLNADVFTVFCNLDQWLFTVGNSMCFAVVLSKLARVYLIFTNPTPKKKVPKDRHLLILIVFLVAIDILILLVPTAIDSARLKAKRFINTERPNVLDEKGVSQLFFFYYCSSPTRDAWLGVSYAYKLLLQAIAVYFAFRTRNVKIRAINDSKYIAAITYVTSLILVALIALEVGFAGVALNTQVSLVGSGRLVYTTVIITLVFIPKMFNLYRDPKGEKIFSPPGSVSQGGVLDNLPNSRDTEKISVLEKKVNELEMKVKSYEETILNTREEDNQFETEPPTNLDTPSSGYPERELGDSAQIHTVSLYDS